ncbi:dynamin family protein [Natronoglycomyces albus]|uniref:Dynamin family protein n=1 Tax=Natronoglycomyces albus TaxID=2811108 RepID=A0A895XN52_9ACTN|nr:dynamin family protein [Natronoglycomyces albus]QSB06784.1 dynamin family protein [Natronoglycomyces albus]
MSTASAHGSDITHLCRKAAQAARQSLRTIDPTAAASIDQLAQSTHGEASIVVVGETKRGKSSLINALLAAPGLSPVDVRTATSTYIEFVHGPTLAAQAWQPGHDQPIAVPIEDIPNWASALGQLPEGIAPPRRMRISHPAGLLKHIRLIDTPGTGGLDPDHAHIALEAAASATCLLMVTDASTPMTATELAFLVEASRRVNHVVFATTKIDAYPGWHTIATENKNLLAAHASRFRTAAHYPVSALLAQQAHHYEGDLKHTLITQSGLGELQRALLAAASASTALAEANVVRAARSEFARLATEAGEEMADWDPDPEVVSRLREEKKLLAQRKNSESRSANLALRTETARARLEVGSRLKGHLKELEESLLTDTERASKSDLEALPQKLDVALQVISSRLSQELHERFMLLAHRVLSELLTESELDRATRSIHTQLTATSPSRRRREANADSALLIASTAGVAFLAGRAATAGAGALGLGALGTVATAALSATGIGIGVAAGAFLLYRRKITGDRQAAARWVRDVLVDARIALQEEVAYRFTEIEYVFTTALDEALRRRGEAIDARISTAEAAAVADKDLRAKKKDQLKRRRDAMSQKVRQLDEVLAKTRTITPQGAFHG